MKAQILHFDSPSFLDWRRLPDDQTRRVPSSVLAPSSDAPSLFPPIPLNEVAAYLITEKRPSLVPYEYAASMDAG